ncbi:DUF4062 domain-containing protein [Streptomyces sp. NPDC046909]|uniref:DUF4062 domain-containing protein n=1 Tax=Streptomyces sp. NPDC046909 TaxID=3155617 RepID=UPI0033EE1A86
MRSEVRRVKVYLSSTWSDLKEYRAAVLAALRRLPLDVVTMEDYTASDERPVEKCLADVASCDIYIGIFALRYGHVPEQGPLNPDGQRSITELEYRKAGETGRPRLVFLLKPGAAWPTDRIDGQEGSDSDSDARVRQLRAELAEEHTTRFFTNPDGLATDVVTSLQSHLRIPAVPAPSRTVAEPPHPRRLTHDLHLLHALRDEEAAAQLATGVGGLWGVTTSPDGLLASTPKEVLDLDRAVTSARAVALLLSPALMTLLGENPGRARRVLDLARARTARPLLGVTAPGLADSMAADAASWGITEVIAESAAQPLPYRLNAALSKTIGLERPDYEIGLPVVVVTMTDEEAESLLSGAPPGPVADIVRGFGLTPESVRARYGASRADWRPFGAASRTIGQVLETAVTGVNGPDLLLRGRKIRLQPYLFDDLLSYDPAHTLLFGDIARNGCLVVADELSLLHPDLEAAFRASPLHEGPQVSLITLAPDDPAAGTAHELIREVLAERLHHAHHRFGDILDPLCEMNVASGRHLDRWLRASLPQTLDAYRNARPSVDKARRLEAELGTRPTVSMARLITEGGGA